MFVNETTIHQRPCDKNVNNIKGQRTANNEQNPNYIK